jgi:hypothetical protein
MNGTTFNANQVAHIVASAVRAALAEVTTSDTSIPTRRNSSAATATTAQPEKRRARGPSPNSAMSRARVLFNDMQNGRLEATRTRVIKAFVRRLRLSPGVANTYYHKLLREKKAAEAPASATGRVH